MNELNQNLQDLTGLLEQINSETIDHELRKSLLLTVHQLKQLARTEQADAVTNELVALE